MYSAESIVAALKANDKLNCEGIDTLGCPSPIQHDGCMGIPSDCDLCKNQECKQRVSIHKDFKRLLVLNFRYMVSLQNQGGFIRKDDSSLKYLIEHKYIDIKLLKSA
jgi:hypothetical protein